MGIAADSNVFVRRFRRASVAQQFIAAATGNEPGDFTTADDNIPVGLLVDPARLDPFGALRDPQSPEEQRRVPQAIYNPGIYGDAVQTQGVLASAIDQIVLSRPRSKRVLLIIQNTHAANSLRFAFDDDSSFRGIQITAGGNISFSAAVPQNDLHLSGVGGASSYVLMFIHSDPAETF